MSEALPEAVQAYLRGALLETLNPLCIELDGAWRVSRHWGEPATYGLAPLARGEDALERFPVLVGTGDAEQALALKFVEIAEDHIAHVHIVPHGAQRYLLLLDAGAEHEHLQGVQQTFHDAKLRSFYDRRLLDKLKRAQAELEEKKREAESASALKSQFIASMSHEFRTPLTSVIGYADLCAGGHALSPGQQTRCAQAVGRNARYLLHLVDNILDEARLAADMLELRPGPSSLDDLAASLRDLFEPLAAERGIAFDLALKTGRGGTVEVDGVRLQQVLVNLIANAVKFTEAGGVTVEIGFAHGVFAARIADTGPGIDPREQQRIFAPFQRTGTAAQAGAGLGLSITRRLLELMGGNLTLDSAPGAGTRWRLELPVEPASAPPQPADGLGAVRQAPGQLGGTVLLVEDNPDIADLVRLYLSDSNVALNCCSCGEEAIAAARRQDPDVVLVDLSLPDMDGFELVRRLREAGCAGVAIAFSAAIADPVIARARAAGMTEFLAKPITRESLFETLGRHLGTHAPQTSAAQRRAGRAPDARRALFERYRESLPGKRRRIALLSARHAAGGEARSQLHEALHQLAGSAPSYGFDAIGAAARTALDLVRNTASPPTAIDAALDALLEAFDAAIGAPPALDSTASGFE